jgi:predicted alpha/beta-hydrolase family hydrolase
METAALADLSDRLTAFGYPTLRFNFPYSESRRKVPDSPATLEACYRAVAQHARDLFGAAALYIGGRSMGGRIASQIAAQNPPQDLGGLVLLAYPLHPPGKLEKLRDAHLPSIQAPMLFISGTRDAFAERRLLESTLARLGSRAILHRIDGGDHSFKVPGRKPQEVSAETAEVVARFLAA